MTALPTPRFDTFLRHDALTRLLQDYAAARPDLVEIRSLGRSHEGRDIWLAVVTNRHTGADTGCTSCSAPTARRPPPPSCWTPASSTSARA